MALEAFWSHRGWNFKKKKKNIGLQRGMKLNLVTILVLNWVCPILSFPKCFQSITNANTCTLAINVFELGPFNPKFQYFTPLFNKISWFCRQQPRKDEASNEGCNSHPIGHDFIDNFDTNHTSVACFVCSNVDLIPNTLSHWRLPNGTKNLVRRVFVW
jgi:hypothetical protein